MNFEESMKNYKNKMKNNILEVNLREIKREQRKSRRLNGTHNCGAQVWNYVWDLTKVEKPVRIIEIVEEIELGEIREEIEERYRNEENAKRILEMMNAGEEYKYGERIVVVNNNMEVVEFINSGHLMSNNGITRAFRNVGEKNWRECVECFGDVYENGIKYNYIDFRGAVTIVREI